MNGSVEHQAVAQGSSTGNATFMEIFIPNV